MRKIRSLIAAFLVVLIQITPGPLGVRPAHAIVPLAAVAVGAGIVATGVMVAGAGVYKPPTFAQANAFVNSVTGDITRKVVVAQMFGTGVSAGLRGFQSQYVLDFQKALSWIQAHPVDFPSLFPAAEKGYPYNYTGHPAIGDYFDGTPFGLSGNYSITSIGTGNYTISNAACTSIPAADAYIRSIYPTTLMGLPFVEKGSSWIKVYRYVNSVNTSYNPPIVNYAAYLLYFAPTGASPTVFPRNYDPAAFATAYPQTQAGQDETDRIAAENPSAVKAPPAGFTSEQIKEATAQAQAAAAAAAASAAQAEAAADPTNVAKQIAAAQAQAAADQATIQAQGQTVELEATPAEETETDIPYNPSALAGPYTLPSVDFGARFQTFIDAIKATSFFSLPGSIASGIPASSISVVTINGGETIGTHNFDFADMNNLWVILRSVVLTGFMFISTRIVCLHR